MSTVYIDLIKTEPAPREKFPSATDEQYQQMVDRYQPWRWVARSGGNHELMAVSSERYFNEADCRHAIDLLFGTGSNIYLRQQEKGNVQLRLAAPTPDAIADAAEDDDDDESDLGHRTI